MKKIILSIEGMTCSACSNGLEKYLNKQKGIKNATVNLVMANSLIEYDEKVLNINDLERFIKEAGFKSAGIYTENDISKKSKNQKVQLIVFAILIIMLMYISMGQMIGLKIPNVINMHINPIGYSIILILLTIAFIIYGFDIIKSGYKNLIHKSPNMDTLVSIGVISSVLYSLYSMVKIFQGNHMYSEKLYFESAAMIIFFIKLGRYLDGVSKDKTKEAIQKLVQITPKDAVIKVNGTERRVTIDQVKEKDILISKPGERISVDGKVTFGKTHVDESFITGESKPVTKKVGDTVIAGSINYDGYIEYEAERIGNKSTISEIIKLVLEATNTKAPIAKLADKVSGYFVPIVIIIAFLTAMFYLLTGNDFSLVINTFVTVLVVACPCSLGLATPLAIVISEGVCASRGILVKKSEVLENAQKIDTIVFDKTGTLTYGNLKISKIYNFSNYTYKEIIQIVGSLEKASTHPISNAFKTYMQENKINYLEACNFEDISGYGIRGKIRNDEIILGNAKILSKYNIENVHKKDEKELAKDGNTIVYVIKNKEVISLIGINDIVRENAKEVIENLKKYKIEPIMLTGDNDETARKIASIIGIENVISNVTPNEKVKTIKTLKEEGKLVMMCGDGINDSPALASSNIGVSVSSGTDIAMDSADVILTKNNLKSIIELIKISKKTIRNIKQNLFWAFFYNTLMIPIAMGLFRNWGILINPMIASIAMVISSLTVIFNALRLRKVINNKM